jgi:hypothetical protein
MAGAGQLIAVGNKVWLYNEARLFYLLTIRRNHEQNYRDGKCTTA